jgi:hypothetical protein
MPKLMDLLPPQFKWDLTEAEKLILKKAPKGEGADCRKIDHKVYDVEKPEEWPEARTVRAKFLEWLLRDKEAQKLIHDKGVRIIGIKVANQLDLECIRLPFPVAIFYSRFEGGLILYNANVQEIDLGSSFIAGMDADLMVMKSSLLLKNIISKGKMRMVGANIGGALVCTGAKFTNKKGNAFAGDGIVTKGDVFMDEIESTGDFRLVGAHIGGNLDCDGAKLKKGKGDAFSGDTFNVEGHVFLYNIKVTGQFRLVSSTVGGGLYCAGASFKNKKETALRMTQAQIDGRLCFNRIKKVQGKIVLSNTKAGAFVDDDKSWPDPKKGEMILDGFEYGSFADKSPKEVKKRLKWLKLRPPGEYIPQPYQQLAKVYRKMGKDRDAKTVLLEKERMRRKYGKLNLFSKTWSYFLDLTIGYGYGIGRAVGFVAAIILLGTCIFYYSKECKILLDTSAAASEIAKPYFNAFFYSIDVFVPFLDLHLEKYWMPDATTKLGWWVQLYRYFHIISGWVFSTLLVAGFTGLIRRE